MHARPPRTTPQGRTPGQGGFTISELVLVLGVFAFLIGIVVVSVGGIESGTSDRDCRTELRALKAATETFNSTLGVYPPDEQALDDAGMLAPSKTPNWDVAVGSDGQPEYRQVGDCAEE